VFSLSFLSLRITYFVEVVNKISKRNIFLTLFFMAIVAELRLL